MRVLAFADANFLAHVSRALEVCKVLRDKHGHDVVFAGDGHFLKLARQAGFVTDTVFTVPRAASLKLANRATLVRYSWWKDMMLRSVQSDLEVIHRHRPDVVLGDMHWSLSISAEVAKIPYISITNAHWTSYFALPLKAFHGHIMTRFVGEQLASALIPALKATATRYWSLPYWKYRRDHGLPMRHCDGLLEVIQGDLTLLADVPEYGPTVAARPPHVHYVGPILWEPDIPDPVWYDRLDPDKPTLYITMGSTGDPLFFEKATRYFGGSRYQVIMTTGGLSVDIPEVPDNFFIEEFARGDRLVEKADVVINHGGNGSIYQALAGGVPVIGAPYHVDQDVNLQIVERLGCGIRLGSDRNLFAALERAIEDVLTNTKYRRAAGVLQKSIHEHGGANRAAGIIDSYLRS